MFKPSKFWKKVNKTDHNGCWVWTGAKSKTGHGLVRYKWKKLAYAHRVAWELLEGEIPEGLILLHNCMNAPCVNPAHIRLGTASDNMRDPDGSRYRMAILTGEQVLLIHQQARHGVLPKTLAERYNVGESTIRDILKGRTWKGIGDEL